MYVWNKKPLGLTTTYSNVITLLWDTELSGGNE